MTSAAIRPRPMRAPEICDVTRRRKVRTTGAKVARKWNPTEATGVLPGHAVAGPAIRTRVLSRSLASDQKVSAISAGSIAVGVAVAVPLTDPAIVTSPT